MYQGWMSFGCNEILSRSRAYGYSTTADCPVNWLRLKDCELEDGPLNADQYQYSTISEAPWFDAQDETTARFFGAYPVSITGLSDGTGAATLTEGILSGGFISGYREAARTMTVTALLIAEGMDALEAGMSWLKAALRPDECGMHGTSCGEVDIQFYVDCPPPQRPDETDADYERRLGTLTREIHGTSLLSAPIVTEEFRRGRVNAYLVRFVLGAGTPYVFSQRREVQLPPTTPIVIQDSPVNLVPYPSAELGSGSEIVARNYSLNPSVETNATGWASNQDNVNITSAMLTAGRVTGELAAVGVASYRVVFTATGAGAAGNFSAQQETDLSALAAGSRVSINMWAAEAVMGGAPVQGSLRIVAYWRAGSGGSILRTDNLGTVDVDGGALSVKSILPPVGATHVLVRAIADLTSWNAGTVVRLYADALAVTVP